MTDTAYTHLWEVTIQGTKVLEINTKVAAGEYTEAVELACEQIDEPTRNVTKVERIGEVVVEVSDET